MKIYTNELGHMSNMAAMTNDLETWYVSLSMQVLLRLFKL